MSTKVRRPDTKERKRPMRKASPRGSPTTVPAVSSTSSSSTVSQSTLAVTTQRKKDKIYELTISFQTDKGLVWYPQRSADIRSSGEKILRYILALVGNNKCELASLYTKAWEDPRFHPVPGEYAVRHRDIPLSIRYKQESEIFPGNIMRWCHTLVLDIKSGWTMDQARQFLADANASQSEAKPALQIFVLEEDGWDPITTLPHRSLSTVFLPPGQGEGVLADLKTFLAEGPYYTDLGISRKYTILLSGPPGTGKSSFIQAITCELQHQLAILHFDQEVTDTSILRHLMNLEDETVVKIEDVDCAFVDRKSHDSLRQNISFSGILNALDGSVHRPNQIIFLTTNYIDRLDPALVRPGRVDKIVRFDFATEDQVRQMFTRMLPDQVEHLEAFVKRSKRHQFTTATLQGFFLHYRKAPNIMKEFSHFEELLQDPTKTKFTSNYHM